MSLLVFGVGTNKIKVLSERRYRTVDFNLISEKNYLMHIPLSPCNLTHLLVTAQFAVILALNTSYITVQSQLSSPQGRKRAIEGKERPNPCNNQYWLLAIDSGISCPVYGLVATATAGDS